MIISILTDIEELNDSIFHLPPNSILFLSHSLLSFYKSQ